MRKYLSAVATLLVVIFLYSCSRNTVNLDYTNASGTIKPLQNLVFRFDHSLMPDSLLNAWDSTEYISFEPEIEGKFRWEQGDELVFSPAKPLKAATTYHAKLNHSLLKLSPYNKIGKAGKVSFSTPDLSLESSNASWVLPEHSSTAVAQLDLYFNYAVSAEALQERLKLELDGQPVSYSIRTLSANNRMSLMLPNIKPQDKDLQIKVTIDKGLVPEGGKNGTNDVTEFNSTIPSPFNLVVQDVSAEHDGTSGTIYVRTSQQVVGDRLTSYISLNPSVPFVAEPTEDGFRITGDKFNSSTSYILTVAKGLRGKVGGTLRESIDNSIAFGELEPSLSFANSKAVYLSSKGAEQLELRITNVPKVKVVISKIYENNLLAIQRYGYEPAEKSGDNDEGYSDYGNDNITLGDVIYEKEIDTRSLPKYGAGRLLKFDVEDRLSNFKGIYHIKVRSSSDYWISDSRFISKSDIGLIAKEGREKMVVFANSIRSAEPLKDANIIAYGGNNQVLGSGVTNDEGVAEISYTRKEFAGFSPAMIIAKTPDDFNYLPFNNTRVNTSRFDVGGKKLNASGLDAFIYGERDIYRPGETVHYSVIMRDKLWRSPGEMPVKMKILFPNGRELKTFRKNLNSQGSLDASFDISNSAITGSYTLEVYSSNDVLISSKTFNVEEFVPDRISVAATLDKPNLVTGDVAKLSVKAMNFFGPPAANRKYELEIQVRPQTFSSTKYNHYSFDQVNPGVTFDKVTREGTTDGMGAAVEKYEVPSAFKNSGLLQANFYTTVFDETGRPVSRKTSTDIFTQDVFFGIQDQDDNFFPLNQSIPFSFIALNKQGTPTSATATIKVIRHEYRTVVAKNGSYFRYESQPDDKLVSEQDLRISGEATRYAFVPRVPGDYEIRIGIPGSGNYVSRSFYSFGSWGTSNSTLEVNTEGNIDIATDKPGYDVNETARVLFKAPFDGRMLVTIEKEQVISHQYINVEKRTASLDLKLSPDHLPNVYITATLIRPQGFSDIPLTVAHGFKNIQVDEKKRKLAVAITAPASSRSQTKQKIRIKTEPGAMVTAAVVDNGILQVTDYKTPDPYGHFYASRALEVNAYDLYPLLFPELYARLSSTGGDMEEDMDKRVNPMPAKRVKLLSYWSGIRQANGNGEVDFDIDIPAFSGQVRIMAVAYKNEKFGKGESSMTIADPLVLSAALPRFLTPGDTVSVPVTVTNTTNAAISANVALSAKGPVRVIGQPQPLQLPAKAEQRAVFRVIASNEPGVAAINVQANGAGQKYSDTTEISIRPASTLQVRTGSGSIAGGQSERISIPVTDFMSGSSSYELVIGRSPLLDIGKQLQFLIEYPYGCTEQVVSSAFPQLYYNDLAAVLDPQQGKTNNANLNVQEAIRKIKLRQLYNGAVTLWDGEGSAHWWATIYAAHFLLEAKKAGFDVDNSLLDGMLNYINGRLKSRETINYYYNRDQQKKIAPKEVAYALYVLSIAGRPNVGVMNYYKANNTMLSLDSKYLLSAGYAVAGDKNRFRELLPSSFTGEESVAQTGGSFYSDIRDEAIALDALIEADPSNSQIPVMAKHVSEKLKQRYWYSTQECAFAALALGKLAHNNANSSAVAVIKSGGKTIATVSDKPMRLDQSQLKGSNVDIAVNGSGNIYYYWQAKGISATGEYREEDNYIKIRRKFFDRNGRPILSNNFKQNDLIVVQLSLEKSFSGTIENIVMTDLLPAGFEIENPRTKEIPGMDWIKDAATPTSLDVRDDRINIFANLYGDKQVYYYAVRAVSPGIFRIGPANAEAMYNGEYHSYNGGGKINISQ
jgi:alpha-2-macroglobulin